MPLQLFKILPARTYMSLKRLPRTFLTHRSLFRTVVLPLSTM